MKFKFLLSDLDGVIRHYPHKRNIAIEQKFELPSGAIFQAVFEKGILTQAVCGLITDERWRQMAADSLAKIYGEERARDAIAEWSDFSGLVDHEYLNFLESRFAGVKIAVLTNGTTRLHTDLAKLKLENSFFKIFNSAEVGVCKPDPKIFQHVIESLQCKPEEIFFVDDSLSHIQAAIGAGMKGHHYRSFEDFRDKYA